MGNDVILRKQPGCWLRSSHSFKECVIAHWSSEVARKITGAKLSTEIAGSQCLIKFKKNKKIFLLEYQRYSKQNVEKDRLSKESEFN